MRAMQDYIDAQYGGPGRGWYRIVTDPFEARKVINQGKLAVVMGMETSRAAGVQRPARATHLHRGADARASSPR